MVLQTIVHIFLLIFILFLNRRAADRITEYYNGLMSANCKPLTMGGDHFVTYPILRAIAAKHGPVYKLSNRVESDAKKKLPRRLL